MRSWLTAELSPSPLDLPDPHAAHRGAARWRPTRLALVVALAVTLAACGNDGGGVTQPTGDVGASSDGAAGDGVVSTDGGTGDAGSTDAGSTDAGSTDAGTTDAGATDAGTSDAGASDAGTADAGDGGATDAGGTPVFSCKGQMSCKLYELSQQLGECAKDSGCSLGPKKCVPANDSAAGICAKMSSKVACAQAEKDGIGCKWSPKGCYLLNWCNPHKTQSACQAEKNIPCKFAASTCVGTSSLVTCAQAPDQKACEQAKVLGCVWNSCTPTNGGKEICDGLDNDCDGVTDDGPAPTGKAAAKPSLCDDGDQCNGAEVCKAGKCQAGAALKCAQAPCQKVSCDKAKGCVSTPVDGGACDDGDACSSSDTCQKGVCVGGLGKLCGDACNLAVCDPKTGQCGAATTKDCDDQNPCTSDSCDKAKGCVHTAKDGGACDDGDLCTTDATCTGGTCGGGKAKVCDDGNACTSDSCDKAKGCTTASVSGPCDDGDPCTKSSCSKGKCAVSGLTCDDQDPCTVDKCEPKTGACTHVPTLGCGWKGAVYFHKHSKLGSKQLVDIQVGANQALWIAATNTEASNAPAHVMRFGAQGSPVQVNKTLPAVYANIPRSLKIIDGKTYVGAQTKPIQGNNNMCAYTMQLDISGNKKWAKQEWFDKPTNTFMGATYGIADGPGTDIYVAGLGQRSNKKRLGFVARYTAKGVSKWRVNLGDTTANFNVTGLDSHAGGNLVITGTSGIDVDGPGGVGKQLGLDDAFLQGRDANGKVMFTRQFGTTKKDWGRKVRVAKDGSLWVVGATEGTLPGQKNEGGRDGFVAHFDAVGNPITMLQVGTKYTDFFYNCDLFKTGGVVAAGNFDTAGLQLVRVGADGKLLWKKGWTASGGKAAGVAVAVAGNGDIVFGGHASKPFGGLAHPGGYQLFMVRVDAATGAIFK